MTGDAVGAEGFSFFACNNAILSFIDIVTGGASSATAGEVSPFSEFVVVFISPTVALFGRDGTGAGGVLDSADCLFKAAILSLIDDMYLSKYYQKKKKIFQESVLPNAFLSANSTIGTNIQPRFFLRKVVRRVVRRVVFV